MDWSQIYQETYIPELPKLWNANFAATKRYLDVFYDESRGILIKPLETTGRVKGATGEFVTVQVDNLVVRSQFTNLYDNITTADYQYYTMLVGDLTIPRDPCTFGIDTSVWDGPYEPSGYKILDVDQPYYKISNDNGPIYMLNSNVSQVVGILFTDPSGYQNYEIVLDPCLGTVYSVAVDSSGAQQYMEFTVDSYDVSWGPTWKQYKYGVEDPCTGVTSGYVTTGTVSYLPQYTDPLAIGDSSLYMDGDMLVARDIQIHNAIRDSSGDVILGYGSPLQIGSSTAVREVNIYTGGPTPAMIITEDNSVYFNGVIEVSGNIDGYLAEASINYYPSGPFIWNGGLLDVSISDAIGATVAYVDGSLAVRDAEIAQNVTDIADVSTKVAQNATDIGDVSTRIPTDFYSQAYVDGSLNAKQDIIPDGTFLKESSIGSGLEWNAGLLDVSVAGGGSGTVTLVEGAGTVNGLTLSGSITTDGSIILGGTLAINNADWSGTDLAVANGGTGASSFTSDGILTGNGTSAIQAESNLTFNATTRIFTVATSTTTGLGAARLGMVNHAGSGNDPGDYLYSGLAWFSDNGSFPPPGEGPAVIMKNWHDGDTHYGYGHIVVDRVTGALYTKYNKNATDATAANGGTWRTIPYQTGTTTNGVVTRSSSGVNVAEANVRFDGTNLSLYNGSTENVRITNTGFVYADQDVVAYSTLVSDERLKENIQPLTGSLGKILQLEGISYDRKKDGSKHLGFIAQQVEPIIPEVVKEQDLPLEGEEEKYKTINYSEIIPHLVEGMKEQQRIIDELKAEIEILKNK